MKALCLILVTTAYEPGRPMAVPVASIAAVQEDPTFNQNTKAELYLHGGHVIHVREPWTEIVERMEACPSTP